MPGYMCSSRLYKIDDVVFEFPAWCGPCPLRVDGEPKTRFSKKDKAVMEKVRHMSATELEKYRIGGGCQRF